MISRAFALNFYFFLCGGAYLPERDSAEKFATAFKISEQKAGTLSFDAFKLGSRISLSLFYDSIMEMFEI